MHLIIIVFGQGEWWLRSPYIKLQIQFKSILISVGKQNPLLVYSSDN